MIMMITTMVIATTMHQLLLPMLLRILLPMMRLHAVAFSYNGFFLFTTVCSFIILNEFQLNFFNYMIVQPYHDYRQAAPEMEDSPPMPDHMQPQQTQNGQPMTSPMDSQSQMDEMRQMQQIEQMQQMQPMQQIQPMQVPQHFRQMQDVPMNVPMQQLQPQFANDQSMMVPMDSQMGPMPQIHDELSQVPAHGQMPQLMSQFQQPMAHGAPQPLPPMVNTNFYYCYFRSKRKIN